MDYINIETTQNIDLEFKVASIGDRILAYCFDLLVILMWSFSWMFVWGAMKTNTVHFVFSIPVLFYSLACEVFFNGQSLGKMVLKIRVVKLDGSELTLGACLIRWVFRVIDIPLYGAVAIISILVSNKSQRLGDIAAGTTVVKLAANNMLSETAFVEVPEGHSVKYKEVHLLDDDDIQIIRDVLKATKGCDETSYMDKKASMLRKTKMAIQKKMAIEQIDGSVRIFLENIVVDYNHLHQ